jgi:hypothetical protein
MNVIITLLAALTPPGVPPVMWAYVALALLYLPALVWAWRQESAQATQKIQVEYKA